MAVLTHTVRGSGEPLLLLHAFPFSGAFWDDAAETLSRHWRVIVPDLPGFGGSARLNAPSIEGMAQAALSLLDAAAPAVPLVVAGLSMGGYVALELARLAPQRVRALGLWSTRAASDTPMQREGRRQLAARIRKEGITALAEASLQKFVGETTRRRQPAVTARVERWLRAAPPDGVVDALQAMAGRRDLRPLLPSLRVPVQVLAGAEDAVIPVAEAEAMAGEIPGAVCTVFPEAGHLINLEAPEGFLQAAVGWLGRLS